MSAAQAAAPSSVSDTTKRDAEAQSPAATLPQEHMAIQIWWSHALGRVMYLNLNTGKPM